MKRIKYSVLRKISVGLYLLTTVGFCLYMVHLGNQEVANARQYTDTEKRYVEHLLKCRESLNSAEHNFAGMLHRISKGRYVKLEAFTDSAFCLRKSAEGLAALEKVRTSRNFMPESQLLSYTATLCSAAHALLPDASGNRTERNILLDEDISILCTLMGNIRAELQERLNVEMDYVENWQSQSFYFFERMEMLLVTFFVLAAFLSLVAYFIAGSVLKSYLERLSFGAARISSGKLDYRFNDTTADVVGNVMRDFDAMAEKLQKQNRMMQRINSELKQKAEELEEAHRHKDKFLANMSHELRTPLNAIIGFSDLLITRASGLAPEKTAEFAGNILKAAEHLLELISDLLEIAKVDAGVLVPDFAEFDIRGLASNVVDILRPLADRKELEFSLDIPDEPLKITADRRLVRQVLINIISNALKFTKAGSVKIKISGLEKRVEIAVTDTGIGISDKDSRLIFKDFHRVEQGLTSNYDGVGLGLTLSKRIIELHKGEIKVNSQLKKGSTFTILLPKEQK